jgi:hypothetical protein
MGRHQHTVRQCHLHHEVCIICCCCKLAAAGLKRSEAELASLGSRLGRLEGSEASNPKASMRLVSALEDKMDSLAAQQVRLLSAGRLLAAK